MSPVPSTSSSSRGPVPWVWTTARLRLRRANASRGQTTRPAPSGLSGCSAIPHSWDPNGCWTPPGGLSDGELAQHGTLLALTREHGGHGLGATALFFADDLPLQQPAEELTVSPGSPEAVELETACPPDDVNEVGLADLEHRFTIMHVEDGRKTPVACGAYTEWEGILAQMGVLVAPDWRRRGLGSLAASIAAHEALASGLTLQWCAEVSNKGALAIARSLGLGRRRHPDQRAAGLIRKPPGLER